MSDKVMNWASIDAASVYVDSVLGPPSSGERARECLARGRGEGFRAGAVWGARCLGAVAVVDPADPPGRDSVQDPETGLMVVGYAMPPAPAAPPRGAAEGDGLEATRRTLAGMLEGLPGESLAIVEMVAGRRADLTIASLRAILAAAEARPRVGEAWTPAVERLPELAARSGWCADVLVFNGHVIRAAVYCYESATAERLNGRRDFRLPNSMTIIAGVTHWMPFPPPPHSEAADATPV